MLAYISGLAVKERSALSRGGVFTGSSRRPQCKLKISSRTLLGAGRQSRGGLQMQRLGRVDDERNERLMDFWRDLHVLGVSSAQHGRIIVRGIIKRRIPQIITTYIYVQHERHYFRLTLYFSAISLHDTSRHIHKLGSIQ